MKLFKKFFAFALTLVLVFGAFGPVPASAASKMSLKAKRTIYVGGCKVNKTYAKGKYTLKLKNLPSKYTVEWESSDPSVATVKNKNSKKTTVKAIAPGKCTVTAKVLDTSTKPNTMTELTCKITIKKDCAAVQITDEKDQSIDKLDLKAGEKKQLFAVMYSEGAKAMTPGKDVTDTVHFVSDKPDLVSIVEEDGKFYAVAGKTSASGVKITCYTTPDASGNYSDISKATATDSITVNVGSANGAMTALAQSTRDAVKIAFASDVSGKLTKSNFVLVYGASTIPATEVTFEDNGTIANVRFSTEFIKDVKYTVAVKNSDLVGTTSMDFTASNGTPTRIELYTALKDNKAIVGTFTKIYFKLYDANGIDVTPTNTDSDEYKTVANRISWEVANSTSEYGQTINPSTGEVSIGTLNKTVTVLATYIDGTTKFQGLIKITAVSAASTLKYVDSTITSSSLAGGDLDWTKTVKGLSVSDDGSYKLVAKVMDGTGSFIYSNDPASRITFGLASSTANHKLYIYEDGQIWPLEEGTEAVNIYYGSGSSRTTLGTVTVNVGAMRIPARMAILVDGVEATSDSFKRTDSSLTTNPVLSVVVYDNYGALYPIKQMSDISVTTTHNTQYGFCNKINSDGTAELTFIGTGSKTGTPVDFLITYTYPLNGTAQKMLKEIHLVNFTPDVNAPAVYSVVFVGSTDMTIRNTADLTKSIEVKLVDSRNGIRYRDITLTTKADAEPGYGYYYVLTKNTASGDVQVTDNVNAGSISIVSVKDKHITKMDTGLYTVHVYLKNTSGSDKEVAAAPLTLTDTQDSAVIKRISEKTSVKFTTSSSQAEMDIALNQCFEVIIGGTKATISTVDAKVMPDACYYRTIKAISTVTIDGTGYTITYPIAIDALVQTAK